MIVSSTNRKHPFQIISGRLKSLALVQFPLNLELNQKAATSKNKKPTDRDRAAGAIASLHPSESAERSLYITNEGSLKTELPGAVHGDLDLLIGVGFKECNMEDAAIAESKALSARRLRKNPGGAEWDLSVVSQPVMELILVGQIQECPTI